MNNNNSTVNLATSNNCQIESQTVSGSASPFSISGGVVGLNQNLSLVSNCNSNNNNISSLANIASLASFSGGVVGKIFLKKKKGKLCIF